MKFAYHYLYQKSKSLVKENEILKSKVKDRDIQIQKMNKTIDERGKLIQSLERAKSKVKSKKTASQEKLNLNWPKLFIVEEINENENGQTQTESSC